MTTLLILTVLVLAIAIWQMVKIFQLSQIGTNPESSSS